MSRSTRKDIVKDGSFGSKYWRTIRRVQKQAINIPRNLDVTHFLADDQFVEELTPNIPHNRQIINDYDFCDYIFRDCGVKFKRK